MEYDVITGLMKLIGIAVILEKVSVGCVCVPQIVKIYRSYKSHGAVAASWLLYYISYIIYHISCTVERVLTLFEDYVRILIKESVLRNIKQCGYYVKADKD